VLITGPLVRRFVDWIFDKFTATKRK